MTRPEPPHRGAVAKCYDEVRRLREEVAELVHALDLSRQREQLVAQQAITLASLAQLERQEVHRLEYLVTSLRRRLAAAEKAMPCTCRPRDNCDQGDDGYQAGPVS